MKLKEITVMITVCVLISGTVLGSVFLGIYFGSDRNDNYQYRVMAYYRGNLEKESLSSFPFEKYTHILFAFSFVDKSEGVPSLSEESSLRLTEFIDYKNSVCPDLKVLLSVASNWEDNFSKYVNSDEKREKFAKACKNLIDRYGLDGIDVDWEYPAPDEYKDFEKMFTAIRNEIGDSKLLSMASTSNLQEVRAYNNALLSSTLDFVNVMTYDFRPSKHSDIPTTKKTIFGYYLAGYSKRQINVGVPFYSRCEDSRYDQYSYSGIMQKVYSGELELKEEKNFSYALKEDVVVSFDTPSIIEKKMKFIKHCGYGGAFAWHASCDLDNHLLNAMLTLND